MGVRFENRDGIAVVTIDNPPVNAMSRAIRQELWDLAHQIEADAAVRAVVFTGAGRLFIGGADISEFDRPAEAPLLPDLLALIETATKPWTVAMHGTTMGGGVEISMACRSRVAAPGSKFGLPEINLGIIPGAGGTQRLARLIGVESALPVVAENKMLNDVSGLKTGYLDRVIEGDLVEGAVAFARVALDKPLPALARERRVEDPGEAFWTAARARIAKSAKGLVAPLRAFEALRLGVEQGFDKGLAQERETFLTLKAGMESAALRYLFFAERAAPKPAALRGITPRTLATAAVIGGGTMGAGITAALRNAGLPVLLMERDEAALTRAMTTLQGIFGAAAKRGLISERDVEARMAGITGVTSYEALASVDLVIEAVFEDLQVKRDVFAALAKTCRADTILATNTSYIDPRLIAEGLAGQDRFIGMHFFSPAQVMKLLEIIPVPETAPEVLASVFDLARRMGKMPVQSGICEGFIGNRILKRYRTEAEAMVISGVPHADIDAALRGFGYAMGPFEMQDLAGLDISYMNREAARARGEAVPLTPGDLLVRAGRKGQKTGGGWYDYAAGDRKPLASAEADAILAAIKTGPEQKLPADEIVARLLAAMADEGQQILDEGIASGPEMIDLVEVHGYGFPRGKGGPMFIAAKRRDGALGDAK